MNRQQFVERNGQSWDQFERNLERLDSRLPTENLERLPGQFRKLCGDLALAEHRMYGLRLCDKLNKLAIKGFGHIHKVSGGIGGLWRFLGTEFPSLVRKEWRLLVISSLLFWGPFIAMLSADFKWVEAVLDPSMMASLDMMYGKGSSISDSARAVFGSGFAMFGFYIFNNVGIDFKIFAGGILFGLGTIFYLLVNGVILGGAWNYVAYSGDVDKLNRFACGHAAFELMGMLVAGIAGLRLGSALISPGRLSRKDSIRAVGKVSIRLLIGAALLTFVAAIIEAFWSARDHSDGVRFIFAIMMVVVLALYFSLAGRGRRHAKAKPV